MRLTVRIWLHGVFLFFGVLTVVMFARFVLSREDAVMALRAHPRLALALADRALTRRADPAALDRELGAIYHETALDMTVYRADGAMLGGVGRPLVWASTAELAGLRGREVLAGDRMLVAALDGARVDAYVVLRMPSSLWMVHAGLLVAVAILIALVFVALPLARSIARPLEQLGGLARALGAGDLGARAPATRKDEIGQLGHAFNAMAGQIQRLRAAERQLLADVSHELRTPLARIRVVLDLASDAQLADIQRYHAEITTDLSELERLLDDIIVSSRLDPDAATWTLAQPPLRKVSIDVGEIIEASVTRFRTHWPARTLGVAPPPAVTLDADPALLRRALDNLLDNARKYAPDDAPIELVMAAGAHDVRIEVVDHGPGIDPADQPRIFTPFFRADRSRTRATGGVGLGLTLVRRIVEAHAGSVGFTSSAAGSRFWFTLPAQPSSSA